MVSLDFSRFAEDLEQSVSRDSDSYRVVIRDTIKRELNANDLEKKEKALDNLIRCMRARKFSEVSDLTFDELIEAMRLVPVAVALYGEERDSRAGTFFVRIYGKLPGMKSRAKKRLL